MSMLEHALTWWNLGYAPLPIRPNGTKAPACRWRDFLETRPTKDELGILFAVDHDGYGIITGATSGHLELIELEGRAVREGVFEHLTEAFADNGLSDLWGRVIGGYLEATPSGGLHAYYRVNGTARPNTKLARRPSTPDELDAWKQAELTKADQIPERQLRDKRVQRINDTQPDDVLQVLIETRGEGGFTVVAPSGGRSHPTGLPWTAITGTPATIPTISADDRDALYTICGLLDQTPEHPADQRPAAPSQGAPTPTTPGSLRPGDDYNLTTSWEDILIPDGWTICARRGNEIDWTRPGKRHRDGMSATTGRRDGAQDCLYVFSSSVDLPTDEPITKFRYYSLTQHGGNDQAAARQLARDGHGDPPPLERPLTLIRTEPAPATAMTAPPPPTNGALAIAPQPATATLVTSLTDKGNADLIVAGHAHHIHYVPSRKAWIVWDGSRWAYADDQAPAIQAAQTSILAINTAGDKEFAKHQKASLSRRSLEAAAMLASTHPSMRIAAEHLDANQRLLNTPAGVADLHTGRLRPASPDDWCTRITTCAPDTDMPTPMWDAFLDQTFAGDQQMIRFVQRLAGYSAGGYVTHHILPFLHGAGGNGKSVFLDVLVTLLGDYATTAPAGFLMAGSTDESAIARLSGQRLVVCSEIDQRARFDEAKVKLLTGGDKLTARFLYGQYFTFTPTHHLWLMGNAQPRVEAGGNSFWRRLRLVPFATTVPAEQRVEDLAQQLVTQEGPGILAWIIRGAVADQQQGLSEPQAVMAATREYAEEEDALGQFANERLHIGGGDLVRIATADVRRAYSTWCRDNGEPELNQTVFGRELRARFGVNMVRSHGAKYYVGMTLLADEEEEVEERWDQR